MRDDIARARLKRVPAPVRDRMMAAAARDYPQYGWERNKGYGTADHLAALREYGPTPLHRKKFAPVAQFFLPLDER